MIYLTHKKRLIFCFVSLGLMSGCMSPKTVTQEATKTAVTPIPAEMIRIEAGKFIMGDKNAKIADEQVQTEINLPTFHIGKYEVTNKEYKKFIEAGGYNNKTYWPQAGWEWKTGNNITQPAYFEDSNYNNEELPVVGVSWYEATAYAKWVGKRLPTEAEWEKASRGTDGRTYTWGEDAVSCTLANFAGGFSCMNKIAKGGSFNKNISPYGVYDMPGNVWEWCTSLYRDYPYKKDDGRENPDITGKRVVRGGSWADNLYYLRCSARFYFDFQESRPDRAGFRLAADNN